MIPLFCNTPVTSRVKGPWGVCISPVFTSRDDTYTHTQTSRYILFLTLPHSLGITNVNQGKAVRLQTILNIIFPVGNQILVFRITSEDSTHYTTEKGVLKLKKNKGMRKGLLCVLEIKSLDKTWKLDLDLDLDQWNYLVKPDKT